MKKIWIILIIVAAIAAGAAYIALRPSAEPTEPTPDAIIEEQEPKVIAPKVDKEPKMETADFGTDIQTNQTIYFEDEDEVDVDVRILGTWTEESVPTWHRTFYDDPAGEGFCWGKEWDTNDDIEETDLAYHGNGWFKWKKDGVDLYLLAVMESGTAELPVIYTMKEFDATNMVCVTYSRTEKKQYHFTKQ